MPFQRSLLGLIIFALLFARGPAAGYSVLFHARASYSQLNLL